MAESRLRAPDLGTQLGVSSCVEKCQKSSPGAGRQPFSGKSFYLDLPAGRSLQFLTGAIQQLGGVIEGFLSREVSYIVSSRREAKAESSGTSPSEVRGQTPSVAHPKGAHARPSQKPADSVPLSRGKELLQKAIKNQESGSGGGSGSSSSLLTNARSWGVRILHVDEMLMHVQQLSLDALCVKKQGPKQKPEVGHPAEPKGNGQSAAVKSATALGTCPAESRTRKVARLKTPFLKVEDESRKFRPFHHQFKSFPEISFLGPRDASPFEAAMTPGGSHHSREPKDREPSPPSAACTLPRRRKGFCECCQEAFEELHAHLQGTRHRDFALEARLYAEVDRVIAQLGHGFADAPPQADFPRPQSQERCRQHQPLPQRRPESRSSAEPHRRPRSSAHPTREGSPVRAVPQPQPGEIPTRRLLWSGAPRPTGRVCAHRQPGSPSSDGDPLWPETLPPSQPSRPRAAPPGGREEDEHRVPGAPEPDGTSGSGKPPTESPAEAVGAGKMPGPAASCQEPGGWMDVTADSPGTSAPTSPVHQCLPTSCRSEFSGLHVAPGGHKRKVQFPGGNPKKRSGGSQPQASFFVPRAGSPGGTRTGSGRPLLSLPLPGHEHRPLASLLPLCHPQTCLSLPESFPWQPTERPAERWATQPPWPGGGWPPGI